MDWPKWVWSYRWTAWLFPPLLICLFTFFFIHDSVKVSGTVTNILQQRTRHGGIAYYPEVTFNDPQNNKLSYRVTPRIIDFYSSHIGDSMDVLFQPSNPGTSRIDNPEEMWFFPALWFFIFGGFLITGWWPYLFRRTKNILSEQDWKKTSMDGSGPLKFYCTPAALKITIWFFLTAASIIVVFSIQIHKPMGPLWHSLALITLSLPLLCLFLSGYLEIFEDGFVFCRHPLFPIIQTHWKDIKKVEMRQMRGMPYLRIHEGPDKSPVDVSLSFNNNFSQKNFIELIKEKSGERILDQSVTEFLRNN